MSDEQVKGIPGLPDKWKLIHCTATNPSNPDHPFGKWRDADILNLLREIASMEQALAELEARNKELEMALKAQDVADRFWADDSTPHNLCHSQTTHAKELRRAALKGSLMTKEDEMSQELKPCPFCGSEARWATTMGGDDSWEIQCSNNDCCLVVFSGNTGEETRAAWNTRASERTNAALLGALASAKQRVGELEEEVQGLKESLALSSHLESVTVVTMPTHVHRLVERIDEETGKGYKECDECGMWIEE